MRITMENRVKFMNTYIDNVTMQETIDEVERLILDNEKGYIVTPNVDHIVKIEKDEYFRKIYEEADLITIDGKPLMWIGKLYGINFKEKVSGSDIGVELCNISNEKGYSIFIMGGKEGVAAKAKEKLEAKYNNINICGVYSPPMGFEKNKHEIDKTIEKINEAKPDILFLCVGTPKQEKFLYENNHKIDYKVAACIGATVDFLAGNVKRAPKWVSNIGFEWFYRFVREPKRLFKRYFVDDMKIIRLVWKYRK